MKIQGWDMEFSTGYSQEHADALSTENRRVETHKKKISDPPDETSTGLRIIRDRIRLSGEIKKENEYQYSSLIQTASSVVNNTGEEITFEGVHAVEKMISSVTGQQASIQNLSAQTDLPGAPAAVGAVSEIHINQSAYQEEEEHLSVASSGHVVTEDGRKIAFSMEMTMDRKFSSLSRTQMTVSQWKEASELIDPIVISLDGKIPDLSDVAFEFDLNADGETEMIHFVSGGSGFLAFDRNGDGIVNDGSELFGPGTGNGFDELSMLDEDGNQWIDENDGVFEKLSVWTKDEQGNDRMISLKEAGIGAVSLKYAQTEFKMTDAENNHLGQMRHSGMFLFEDGRAGTMHQIDLSAAPVKTDLISAEPAPAGLNNTDNLSQESAFSLSGMSLLAGVAPQPMEIEPVNPLKALLDKLEEMKEELGRLYEKMHSGHGLQAGSRSSSGKRSSMGHLAAFRLNSYLEGPVRNRHRRFV